MMTPWRRHAAFFAPMAGWSLAFAPLPALAQQAPSPQTATTNASAYRINAGDQLEIYVWGEERLQRTVKVLPDGTIAFPLVGQIAVQGYLPKELEAVITKGLSEQYRGQVPQVTVSVVSPAGLQFSVIGKVNSPGNFTPGRYVNVLEAITLAGGPSQFANLDNIVIIRKTGDRLQPIRVQLGSVFKGNVNAQTLARTNIVPVESGDTIIVP